MPSVWWIIVRLALISVAYVVFKRVAGLLVSLAASSRKIKVSVESIGFLVVRGVAVTFAQGPVACLRLREVSLGRSASAKKAAAGVASAVTSLRPRIPLNCRGVELHLRVPPPLPPGQKPQQERTNLTGGSSAPEQTAAAATEAAGQPSATAAGPARTRAAAASGAAHPVVLWARTAASRAARGLAAAARWLAAHLPPLPVGLPLRMAGSMALQLLLALVPSVPVRAKDIVVSFEELGIWVGVERVVLLLHSSNMFSQLDASATVSSITGCVRQGGAAGSAEAATEETPWLDIKSFTAAAALGVYWRAGGLRCLSLNSELGESVATLTPALLEAAISFQPPPRQQQRQRSRRRGKPPKPRPPMAGLLPRLLARAPQQAEFKAPLLALRAAGFTGESGEVRGQWQARGLRLWSDTRPPPGRRRSVADGLRRASGFGAETQLLQVMGSLGSVDAQVGKVGRQSAASVQCPGATLSAKLLQTPQGILTWRQPPALTARVSADIGAVEAGASMAEVWSAAAVGLEWHTASSARRRQLQHSSLLRPPDAELRQPSADLRAESAASMDLPVDAVTASKPELATAVGIAESAPGRAALGDEGGESKAAEPPPQPARFQLDARISLSAAGRFALLAPDGSPAATLSSSGVSLLATTEGLPGSAVDRRSSTAGGALDAVPEQAPVKRLASSRQSPGGSTAVGHGRTASAAATPETLRASREMPAPLRSASAWLRGGAPGFHSGGGGSKPAAARLPARSSSPACRLDLGTLTVSIACNEEDASSRGGSMLGAMGGAYQPALPSAFDNSAPAASDDPTGLPTAAASSAQAQHPSLQLLRIETVHLDLAAQPVVAASDIPKAPVELEGNVLVSGIVAELDKVHAARVLRLGAASLPDEAFLAAMQRLAAAKPHRPPQLTAQPRKPRSAMAIKPGRMRLASVAITLQGWGLSYCTASSVLGDHSSRLRGTSLQVQHRLALNSVSAELLLPEKTVTAHVVALAVSQEQQQQAAAQVGASDTSTAAAAEAHVCQLLHIASVSAGVLPPGHTALRQPAANAETPAGSTGSFAAGGAVASSNSGPAAGPAVDLDISGVSVRFEPDTAFGAIDTVGELAGITKQAKQQLPQHWQQRLNQRRGQKAATGNPAPEQQKAGVKLCMALQLHNLAANVALTPDVCFAVKVDAVEHHLGSLAAGLSALAVQLNGQDVATVLQLRAAAQLARVPGASARNTVPTAGNASFPAAPKVSAARGGSNNSSTGMAVASRSRPSLTIQLPDEADGSGGVGGASAAPAAQPLAMPYENDAPRLARARAAAGVSDDSSSPVFAPAMVVTAAVAGARILLPHGCELGTAVRGTELWAKAFSQELKDYVALRLGSKSATRASPKAAKAAPAIELRLRLQDVAFVMQHHEMEAWLAAHGRALREAVTEQRLWLRALETIASDGTADGRRLAVQRRMASDYRAACLEMDQVSNPGCDLMRAGLAEGEMVLLVCGGGAAGEAATRQHIEAVDPPTKGVPLRQLLRLQLDAAASGVAVHFCGNSQPLASVDDLTATGVIGIGRQVTAPPASEARAFDVGRHRRVTTQVSIKGCRSEVKVYTDLAVGLKGVGGAFGVGLQPTIGLVAAAGKRMGPSDPDKSRPKPEKLPWWDLMRFLWRGRLRAHVRDVDFSLGTAIDPEVTAASRRLQVAVKQLDVVLADGAMDCTFGGLTATAHAAADPVRQPGQLLALPFAEVGTLLVMAAFAWHLPDGRSPDDHHIFPIPAPEGEGAVQLPIPVAAFARSSGYDVALTAILGPPAPITGPMPGSSDESGAPVIFFGDHQMRFMQELIATFKSPPAFLKMSKNRGTYFARKPSKGAPPEPDVVKLLRGLELGLQATPIEIMHWTADVSDPSCGVTVSIADVQYAHKLRLNQSLPAAARASLPTSHPGTASETLRVEVEGQQLRILLGAATPGDAARLRRLQERSGTAPSRSTSFGTTYSDTNDASPRSLSHSLSTDQAAEPIAVIEAFSVHKGSLDENLQADPAANTVQAALQDCRFAFDLDSRNAMWGAALHMAAGVAPFQRPPFKKPGAQGSDAVAPLPADEERPPDGPAGLEPTARVGAVAGQARQQGEGAPEAAASAGEQRTHQAAAANPPSPARDPASGSDADTGGELMRLLLRQDRAEAAATGADGLDSDTGVAAGTGGLGMDTSDLLPHDPNDDEDLQSLGSPAPDAAQPSVRFRIQVTSLQVAAIDTAGGRFLLAAETAHVMGVDMPSSHRVTSLAVREVQAYISKSDAEGSPWLTAKDGELAPASTAIRQVFMPFSLQLRHTKGGRTSGQDLRLQAPEIHALLDSREFLTFVDVVRHVMMPPPPDVYKLNEEASLLEEPEDESVATGREAFALLYQELASLATEAQQVRAALPGAWHRTTSRGREAAHARIKQVSMSTLELAAGEEAVADVASALQQYFADLLSADVDTESARAGRRLLLQWLEQQGSGAAAALQSVMITLKAAKTAARKRQLADHAAKVAVDVDAVKWSMCHDRTPFFASALSSLKLAMTRNEDNSGSSKFLIYGINIEEPAVPAAISRWGQAPPLTASPKPIVSAWNPDESWDDDPAVRATAVLGVPTPERLVYDNLDLLVHPLAVSFTDQQLNQLWEYFFPKEEDPAGGSGAKAGGGGQELWMKSALSRTLKRGGGGSGSGRGGRSNTAAAAVAANPPLTEETLAALSEGDGSGPDATSTAAAELRQSGSNADGTAPMADAVATLRNSASKWSLPRSWTRGSSSTSGTTPKAPDDALAAFTPASASRRVLLPHVDSRSTGDLRSEGGSGSRKQRSKPPARVALFRHVRFNRVHMSITYKGHYFSLNDAKMVLDNRVYDGLEGPWRDLFQRLKWDIVKSVLKSMTGLQGRKVKELLPSHLRAAVGKAERRVLQKSARAWLAARGGGGSSGGATAAAPQLDDAALQELRKVRLLLGRKHVDRVAAAMAADAARAAAIAAETAAQAALEAGEQASSDAAAATAAADAVEQRLENVSAPAALGVVQ